MQNRTNTSKMHTFIPRQLEQQLRKDLVIFPIVAILGPRQTGKSTLVKHFLATQENTLYLDLEKPSDLRKLEDPELFFHFNQDKLICLDEIQLRPDFFPILRSIIDEHRRPGNLILLGSASGELLRQSAETLTGRISYLKLTPFLTPELIPATKTPYESIRHWIRGGYPESYLAPTEETSFRWREAFTTTYIKRDVPLLAQRGNIITSRRLQHLLSLLAHNQGQLLNSSRLGESLGVSYHTVRHYLDILEQTFLLRILPPFTSTLKKRLKKSPKTYLRDSGILHTILSLIDQNAVLGHPVLGASWEGFVIEQLCSSLPSWEACYYRTAQGNELDLILQKGNQRIAIECKASSAPTITKGFWNALEDIQPTQTWVIAPVQETYPLRENVFVGSIQDILKNLITP